MSPELALFVLLGAFAAATAPFIPVSWRLGASLVLSPFQLYLIPAGATTFSIWLASTYLLWPELLKESRNLVGIASFRTLMILMLVQIVSWSWSPDVELGVRNLVYALPFLLLGAGAMSAAKQNPTAFVRLLELLVVCMLVEAFLVVLFRLDPDAKWSYFSSGFAGLFSGPNTVKLFLAQMGVENNYLALGKAGGFLVNGNVAAAYLGIGALTAYYLDRESRTLWLRIVGFILWISVFFAGSKIGDILAVMMPLAAGLMPRYVGHRSGYRLLIALLAIGFVAFVGYEVIHHYSTELTSSRSVVRLGRTVGIRLLIWAYALQAFHHHPLLGQGFGGWEAGFAAYAHTMRISAQLPPHNTLVRLWSESGIIAALLGLIFMFQVIRHSVRLVANKSPSSQIAGLILFSVAGWIFVHGLGTNSGLLGDVHELPLLACVTGFSYAVEFRRETFRRVALAFV